MTRRMLSSDKVILLLSLVPYLREYGPAPVSELAERFQVSESELRRLVTFLGTAGIPGETLAYQHDDLFDIDWDLFERDDMVSLTHTVAVDDAPRFTWAETAALLAGLEALKPLLTDEDSLVAERLRRRLADAMTPAVSIAETPRDETTTALVRAIEERRTIGFTYHDLSRVRSDRTVNPLALTEREQVWYLRAFDVQRGAERTFRVAQMSEIEVLERVAGAPELAGASAAESAAASAAASATESAAASATESSAEIIAHIPQRLLPVIRGFDPEVTGSTSVPVGSVEIRIEAWHPGAAVRLVQHAPGAIEIISPPSARAAVSDWAERARAQYVEATYSDGERTAKPRSREGMH